MPIIPPSHLDFHCTRCEKCCCGLWLPLSIAESLEWLREGLAVDVFCSAIVWAEEPGHEDRQALYKRARSFAAHSGSLPLRVQVTLATPQGNRCPHLDPQGLCGIYTRRPTVCRVYPAEPNPFLPLLPANRQCPPESWQDGGTALLRDGRIADVQLQRLAAGLSERGIVESRSLEKVCAALDIRITTLAQEGFALHSPAPQALCQALQARHELPAGGEQDWRCLSARTATRRVLEDCGAVCIKRAEIPQQVRLVET